MIEKLKRRSIRLHGSDSDPAVAESAARLLRDVNGVLRVRTVAPDRLIVSYNVRRITLQIIEALLAEFGYELHTGFFCRCMRALCHYFEDIECSDPIHDMSECTREVFITRYLRRPHGCRDHRPEYLRRYL